MAKLKVFGMNWCGTHRRIVAATSQKAAAEILGISPSSFRLDGSETHNQKEIELAMQEPGVVWQAAYRDRDEWKRLVEEA